MVAGGSGRRFGGAKQFAIVGGRSVVDWSVRAARSVAEGVVVVLPPDDTGEPELGAPSSLGADAVVVGGPTRAASVRAGLARVPEAAAIVVVHDAVRPLAPPWLFESVVAAVRAGAEGAVPALPVGDTVKRVVDGTVAATVDRRQLVTVQTPQAFSAEALRRAHADEPEATDDAALLERLGATVRVVEGDARNLKITRPGDLELVAALADVPTRPGDG